MLWPYIIAAIAVLFLAGFLLIRHTERKNQRFLIELRKEMAKAYREGMIARGEIPADDETQNQSMCDTIDAKWRKEGKHT